MQHIIRVITATLSVRVNAGKYTTDFNIAAVLVFILRKLGLFHSLVQRDKDFIL